MSYDKVIHDHYRRIAQSFKLGANCSIQDPKIREAETKFILGQVDHILSNKNSITTSPSLLDIGCGNGHMLSQLREKFSFLRLFGIEFSQDLYELAKSREIADAAISLADCRQENFFKHEVDIVLTERVLINILNRKDQRKAVVNISKVLKPGGKYIMVESFREPLHKLNKARKELLMDDLQESAHNLYLNESLISYLEKQDLFEVPGVFPSNYLSTHFFISRILHPLVRPKGAKIKFSEFEDFFDQALPSGVGRYSPILFRVFEKKTKQ